MGKLSRFVIAAACSVSLLLCLGASLAWAHNPVDVDPGYNSGTPGWGDYAFATIQNGVNAVDVGGTVNVAAGTYAENNILITWAMTVQGGGIGTSIIDASASVATGNVVKINITSGNVLFDGFTIKTGVSLHGMSPKSTSSGSTITISHNRIEGFGPTATDEKNYGLIAQGSAASLVFTYNTIANCGDNTILLERHVGPTDVSYNTFDRTAGNWSSSAYFNMNYGGADITTLQRVSHNTIDMGAGTVFTNDTRGEGISFASSYTPPDGIGGYTSIEITDNVIKNLKPYRRGIGLWNGSTGSGSDGDFDAPVIARNTILGNTGATGSYGIRLLGHVTDASITDNDCDRLDYGVWVRVWNGHIATGTVAHRNSLTRCSSYGMLSEAVSPDINAENNWWGSATGPSPTGTGSAVSSYVDFTPWVTTPNAVSIVPSYALTNCTDKRTVTFHIEPGAAMDVRGYEVKFDVNTSIATVASLSDIKEKGYLSSVGTTTFYATGGGGGGGVKTYTVACAILGGNVGAKVAGDLFTVDFTPVVGGTSAITITSLKVRDLNNVEVPASGTGGSIQVDCTPPTMETINEAQGVCYKTAPTFANFGFDDNLNLDLAEYQIDALGWNVIFTGINAAFWDSDGWVLSDFGGSGSGLSEGSHTVVFRVKDDAGNYNAGTYSWSFIKDTVAPAAPTNFVAMPGHNKVHLTWTNPTGDASFVGVEIRRVGWTDYPQYGTGTPPPPVVPEPGYPSGPTVGDPVVVTSAQAYDDNPRTPRDIYYYAAFSYDCAGNYSALDDGAKDRSTSYWLGDMAPPTVWDGIINSQDVGAFSFTFGATQSGGGGWNPEGDFGPTDDNSRFGIPRPDNVVDFEDLMILAMNHGNVSASGTSGLPLLATAEKPLRDLVSFKLVPVSREGDHVTYALVIENGAKVLKGFALKLSYGVGNELVEVKASAGLSGKGSEHFFGTIEREMGKVEVCVAALGVDVPFEYTGEVARVVVREEGSNPVKVEKVVLRDVTNQGDEVVVAESHETPFIPAVSALMQNHPNPFNPVTQITYDVAVAGAVTIEIYDVSGHRVRTLVSGPANAGRHVIEWNGKDENGSTVHTGVYFYRMSAPGYVSPAKKMLLLK